MERQKADQARKKGEDAGVNGANGATGRRGDRATRFLKPTRLAES